MDVGCAIKYIPQSCGDDHKRLLVRVAIPEAEGIYQPTVHYDCIHNQVQSIHNRVCGVVPKPTKAGYRLMSRAMDQIIAHFKPCEPDDVYALSRRHRGGKGLRYKRAADELCSFGLHRSDSSIKMFVKPERFDPTAKRNPDPRAIQYRGPKYCVAIAQYLRPVEEQIYTMDFVSDGVPRSRNVAKGLNSVERAELLVEKASHFDEPVFITLDASRFDKHVNERHLKLEHKANASCYGGWMRAEVVNLLSEQLNSRCFSSRGIKYVVKGRRMSGDMNTASGNVLIMVDMIIAYMRHEIKCPKWDCLDDGDDFVLIIEVETLDLLLATIVPAFLEFGMEMKVEEPVRSVFDVEFCQAKVVEYDFGRYKFVRDYRKVISRATSGVRNWENPVYRVRAIHAIGTCELILNLGVPILQAYACALLRNSVSGDDGDLHHAPEGLRCRAKRDMQLLGIKEGSLVQPQPIRSCARSSFARAFGVSEVDQHHWERRLSQWTFNISTVQHFGSEWDVETWAFSGSMSELY